MFQQRLHLRVLRCSISAYCVASEQASDCLSPPWPAVTSILAPQPIGRTEAARATHGINRTPSPAEQCVWSANAQAEEVSLRSMTLYRARA